MVTPKEALIRGGHKNPEQILADLERGSCVVLNETEAEFYDRACEFIEQGYPYNDKEFYGDEKNGEAKEIL